MPQTDRSRASLRRLATTLICLFLLASCLALGQTAKLGPGLASQIASAQATDQLQVIATFNGDKVSPDQIAAVKALGIRKGLVFDGLPMLGVLATPSQVQALANLAGVRSVWPNLQLKYFNYEATALTGVQRLRTDPVLTTRNHGLPYSGKGVTVQVNDTGVDGTHVDLQYGPHLVQNVEAVTNLNAYDDLLPITYLENIPMTETAGHGTHVAGIVGGTGAKSNGKYQGVAPGANLVGYGSGAVIFVLDALGGLNYAITHQAQYGLRVINNSWGTTDPTFDPEDPVNVASKRLYDLNIVVVFAAGNDGPGSDSLNPYSKAPWVIGVANAHKDSRLDDTSSRGFQGDNRTIVVGGQTWTVENRPTITAPGTNIISVRAVTNTSSLLSSNGPQDDANMIEPAYLPFYTVLSGTSMASPHVAGIVALMLEANPSLSAAQVKQILQQTATNLPGYETWEAGAGMVNAYAAVDRAARSAGYGQTLNMVRTFHANAIIQASKSNFTIDYNPIPSLSPTQNRFSFQVSPGLAQLEAKVNVSGILGQTGNTINLVLIAPDGTETSSGVSLLFPVFTDRVVVVPSPMVGDWVVELRGLRGDAANPTSGAALPETVAGVLKFRKSLGYTGLNDIAGNPAENSIQIAVSERLIDGFSDKSFRPSQGLTRAQLADYLVMGAGIRQFLPTDGTRTFTDVGASLVPFAEAAASRGAALRDVLQATRGVMLPKAPGLFAPNDTVRRVDIAYALVQSLGLEQVALSKNGQVPTVLYNGQRIPLDDAAQIPAGLEGYVQVALDLNVLNAFFSLVQGPYDLQPTIHATFQPLKTETRADYAVDVTRFFFTFFADNTQ